MEVIIDMTKTRGGYIALKHYLESTYKLQDVKNIVRILQFFLLNANSTCLTIEETIIKTTPNLQLTK